MGDWLRLRPPRTTLLEFHGIERDSQKNHLQRSRSFHRDTEEREIEGRMWYQEIIHEKTDCGTPFDPNPVDPVRDRGSGSRSDKESISATQRFPRLNRP
jgi:hypothetical protein